MKRGARNAKRGDQASPTVLTGPVEPPRSGPVFDAENIQLQRRMRFNPLRALDPENLSLAHDQFDLGILRQAALLWDAMIRRDDTLSFVEPQLENAVAAKPWGVFKKKNADPVEAARHAAALEYFYANVTAVDAFDRNVRGDRHLLLKQMGASYAMRYAVHHFVWKPVPGKMIEVEDAAPVPALTAELEYVPLWFFENVSGTLRFLPFGGFGLDGQDLNWEGEWMVTTGQGMMFAAASCYVFKRLTFQDWTVFNERYAQQKVIGQTTAQKDSEPGRAMAEIVESFNSDMGIVLYESQPGGEPPISLLGPEGTASVDLFERFLDRQDRKLTVMFRGSDLRNMSREKDTTGVSAQNQETEALENAHCASIASACRTYIDRAVIRYCFGADVEPLAYFGLPEMEQEDAKELRESAGFLADRGALVELDTVAERLGITLTEDPEDALQAMGKSAAGDDAETQRRGERTANAREYQRDELGRFAPKPVTNQEKKRIIRDAKTITDERKEFGQIDELLQTVEENEDWRDHYMSAKAHQHFGGEVPREKMLNIFRRRDRESHALMELHAIAGLRRRAENARFYPPETRTGNADLDRLQDLVEEALRTGNGNPYHDRRGEFTSAPDKGGGSGGGDGETESERATRLAERARKKTALSTEDQRAIIHDVLSRADNPASKDGEDFGAVSSEAVTKAAAANQDIRGFTKRIEPDAVRHVERRHTDPAVELSRNQVPVTRADYDHLPEVFDHPDSVESGKADPDGSSTLIFRKKLGEHFQIVAHVRRGKQRLAFKTLTKERSPAAS